MRTLILILTAVPLLAHDMWMEPASFTPEAGDIIGVKLRVGQDLLGDPLARDSSLIQDFFYDDGTGRKPLVGRDGANPAGFLRVAAPAFTVVGYASNPSRVELTPEKFNQYLKDEGLDAVAAERARSNQTNARAREQFSRCAKSLLLIGNAPAAAQVDKPLGFTLELVAEKNPYALRPGQELPVRLTYHGRPLAGALVVAMNKKNPSQKLTARTDRDGRVHFAIAPGGMWLIKAVHMIAAPAGSDADWTSYWASLTFEPAKS